MQKEHPNWDLFCKKFSTNFVTVKSFVTVAMTIGLIIMLSGKWVPPERIETLYCSAYSAMITFFFTKAKEDEK